MYGEWSIKKGPKQKYENQTIKSISILNFCSCFLFLLLRLHVSIIRLPMKVKRLHFGIKLLKHFIVFFRWIFGSLLSSRWYPIIIHSTKRILKWSDQHRWWMRIMAFCLLFDRITIIGFILFCLFEKFSSQV